MYKIKTLNNISSKINDILVKDNYLISPDTEDFHAVLLRSFKMHDMELPESLLAVVRAGAGVNNIPIDKCSDKGIVVFNTPGANANAVAELVIAGLLVSSRNIFQGMTKVIELKDDNNISKTAEKVKKEFVGPELMGKTLGVIGLGAIGVKVVQKAISLGMNVIGFDPFLSVESAWSLPSNTKKATNLEELLSESDYLTVHVPLTDETKNFINSEKIEKMKSGVRIFNFSRGDIVSNEDVKKGIKSGKIKNFVTDFAYPEIVNQENILVLPHLGASTPEAEDNCAIMAANQLDDFMKNGNIVNSVNFPTISLERSSDYRLIIINKNIPNVISQITSFLANKNINILDMINKSRNDIAYNIIEIDNSIDSNILSKIMEIEGVVKVRLITK